MYFTLGDQCQNYFVPRKIEKKFNVVLLQVTKMKMLIYLPLKLEP